MDERCVYLSEPLGSHISDVRLQSALDGCIGIETATTANGEFHVYVNTTLATNRIVQTVIHECVHVFFAMARTSFDQGSDDEVTYEEMCAFFMQVHCMHAPRNRTTQKSVTSARRHVFATPVYPRNLYGALMNITAASMAHSMGKVLQKITPVTGSVQTPTTAH